MIGAKLKGEGRDVSEPEEPGRTNVVDIITALKTSLGKVAEEKRRKGLPPPRSHH
jgi:non-homologous end joining protein Ku